MSERIVGRLKNLGRGRGTVLTMAYSTFQTGFVAVSIIYPATSSTFKRLSAEKKADIPMIFVSLHKISCARQTKSKLYLPSLALSLHKISCARETESKLSIKPAGIIHAQ